MKNRLRLTILVSLPLITTLAFSQAVKQVYASPPSAPGPISIPAQGRDGGLYTTASGDGITHTNGAVLETPLIAKGTRFLHTFTTADGTNPASGLTLGLDGNYYGAAPGGGDSSFGALFKITPSGTYTVLHQFTGATDGGAPTTAPIQASDGNLYGNTSFGNVNAGTVYRLVPSSGTFTTIFSFPQDGSQANQLWPPWFQASDGNLYGTTELGGVNNAR